MPKKPLEAYEDISVLFAVDQAQNFKYASLEYAQTTNKDHGRIEVRECWSTSNPEYLNLIRNRENWLGLKSIAMVIGTRIIDGKETKKVRIRKTLAPGAHLPRMQVPASAGNSKKVFLLVPDRIVRTLLVPEFGKLLAGFTDVLSVPDFAFKDAWCIERRQHTLVHADIDV